MAALGVGGRSRWRRRMRLRRSPLLFWLATAALAAVSGMAVARIVGTAEARARDLGGLRSVPVAVRALEVGTVVRAADVEQRRLPIALLPGGVDADIDDPIGSVVAIPVLAGEVVLAAKLAPAGLRGAAALIPAGRRALAVPTGAGLPPLEPGNRVDILVTFDIGSGPAGGDGAAEVAAVEPTFAVATDAVVVDVTDQVVTVAVLTEEAAQVAFALAAASSPSPSPAPNDPARPPR